MLGSNPETPPKILRGSGLEKLFLNEKTLHIFRKSFELRAFHGRKKCTIRKDSLDLSAVLRSNPSQSPLSPGGKAAKETKMKHKKGRIKTYFENVISLLDRLKAVDCILQLFAPTVEVAEVFVDVLLFFTYRYTRNKC
jgi:hypothetical protein